MLHSLFLGWCFFVMFVFVVFIVSLFAETWVALLSSSDSTLEQQLQPLTSAVFASYVEAKIAQARTHTDKDEGDDDDEEEESTAEEERDAAA